MPRLKSLFCRSKYLVAAGCLAAGEFAGLELSFLGFLWPMAAAVSAGVFALAAGFRFRHLAFLAAFLAGTVAAMRSSQARREAFDRMTELGAGSARTIEIAIPDVAHVASGKSGDSIVFPADVYGVPSTVVAKIGEDGRIPRPGETWRFTGWMSRRGGPMDGRRKMFRTVERGTGAEFVSPAPHFSADRIFAALRENLSRRMSLGLEDFGRVADLNRAILLGERWRIDGESRKTFASAGAIHIFAISGLHVLIVAKILSAGLALLCIPRRFSPLLLIPALWVYVRLAGMPPSAVRAAVMASFWYAAILFWRRPDTLTAWTFAFFVSFLHNPFLVFDAGAILSFTVMLSLALIPEMLPMPPNRFLGDVRSTLVAWAAGVPVIAHLFGRFTPAGLAANILMIPLVVASVTASALSLAAGLVCDLAAAWMNRLACYATLLMDSVSVFLSSLPFSDFEIAPWSFAVCMAWYAAFAAGMYLIGRRLSLKAKLL